MARKKGGVYRDTDPIVGFTYDGRTNDFERRRREHGDRFEGFVHEERPMNQQRAKEVEAERIYNSSPLLSLNRQGKRRNPFF